MNILSAIVGVMALLVISSVWRGYVLTLLWGWFIVATFGLPALTLAAAIGMSLVVSFLTYQGDAAKASEGGVSERFIKAAAQSLLFPAAVLGFGAVVHQFM